MRSRVGGITEEQREETGETLENRVVIGLRVQKIRGQGHGKALGEERQEVGVETGDRETLYLEVGGEMDKAEVEAAPRDPPGLTWTRWRQSDQDGREAVQVEVNPTRTGGVPTLIRQQPKNQTSKWYQ